MTNFNPRFTLLHYLVLIMLLNPHPSAAEGLKQGAQKVRRSRVLEATGGVVAADHKLCSVLGSHVLEKGGHAIDAAVAVAFCLGVVNPGASGIGGGGFLIVRSANGTAEAYDFRETAPGLATEDMYRNNTNGKFKDALSVGVPGELAGLYKVWQKYGKLPWKDLVEPSVKFCDDGFVVEPFLANEIALNSADILGNKGLRDAFAPNGTSLQAGDTCFRKQLGKTLKQIAEDGPVVFYGGAIGKRLVQDVQDAGGIMKLQDLETYEVKVKEPIVADTWGYTILGMPPPSSGGAGLTLILNILEKFTFNGMKGNLGVHRMIEAFKHTYAMRMNLGDPEFSDMSVVQDMLSPVFADKVRSKIADNTTYKPDFYSGRWGQSNDHGTSHVCVVDTERNAVSMTTTINSAFGSKLLSTSTGIILNDQMNDFSTPTDVTKNSLPPSKVNLIEPLKRPLSTMSPTIVLEKGQLIAVIGGSGGVRILTSVAQVLLNHIAGYGPLAAVELPRVHHQLEPNSVLCENFTSVMDEHVEFPFATIEALKTIGHNISSSKQAACQFVLHDLSESVSGSGNAGIHTGKLTAVSDFRKDGYPAGFDTRGLSSQKCYHTAAKI